MTTIRVPIADDVAIVRDGLRATSSSRRISR
jgi:hypothetical protein